MQGKFGEATEGRDTRRERAFLEILGECIEGRYFVLGIESGAPAAVMIGSFAAPPINATRVVLASGRISRLFLRRTTPSEAAFRRRLLLGLGLENSGVSSGCLNLPALSTRERTSRTRSSTVFSSTRPWLTALTRAGPQCTGGPGISRSKPALTGGAVEYVPHQSDMTSPLNPHSLKVANKAGFSEAGLPLTVLYLNDQKRTVGVLIRSHDTPGHGVAHGNLKRHVINLTKSLLGYTHIDIATLPLGLICNVVFDRCTDTLRL